MLQIDFSGIQPRLRHDGGKTYIFDPVRRKWIVLTPEEQVRQYLIEYLAKVMQYPMALMAVEKMVAVGTLKQRFDLVIFNRDHQPWMLVECKAPTVPLTEATLRQLLRYQGSMQSQYWLLTNGHQTFCADARDADQIMWLPSLPAYEF